METTWMEIIVLAISDYGHATRGICIGDRLEVISSARSIERSDKAMTYLVYGRNGKPYVMYEHEIRIAGIRSITTK